MLVWAAANLDEREFPDPERFDIRRRAPRHLSLGHGVHFCLGASFARLEARIAWEEFLRRLPDHRVTTEPRHFLVYVQRLHGPADGLRARLPRLTVAGARRVRTGRTVDGPGSPPAM